jgi:hypothetical protein
MAKAIIGASPEKRSGFDLRSGVLGGVPIYGRRLQHPLRVEWSGSLVIASIPIARGNV